MSATQGAFAHGDTDDHRRQKDISLKTKMNFCGISYVCNSDYNYYDTQYVFLSFFLIFYPTKYLYLNSIIVHL